MRVWRLCLTRHATPNGEGACLYGGRWNFPGSAIVYTSSTLSLAALEFLVHLDPDLLPEDLIAVSADFPDHLSVHSLSAEALPPNWREYPAPETLQAIGTRWATSRETVMLSVPSAVIPDERSYLLNPAHPEFGQVRWNPPVSFHLDPRFLK